MVKNGNIVWGGYICYMNNLMIDNIFRIDYIVVVFVFVVVWFRFFYRLFLINRVFILKL